MSEARDKGRAASEFIKYINWYWNMKALALAHYSWFKDHLPQIGVDYERGNVVIDGINKYLLQGDGRLDNRPLSEQSLLKLFRDDGEYEWVREEYCLNGWIRVYMGKRYEVISDYVDSATPPSNDERNWKLVQ